ncbi:Ulp1 family isopeptidase [Bradyrhizobium elkanii]|nr:Ulp1 family isopeptidase [Bradyrhizobium elkanii]WLA79560.1 Ulp1 family isopeptidase [Bradyrhizobium elkanii]
MAQQQNTYDCGVFVVDGTRALVRQLEQGREPDLLNVVANRQALQNRLRG